MRCFVAVDLDPSLRRKIETLQKELAGLDTKLVEPENLHFTLKFLGEVDEALVNKVKELLRSLTADHEPFGINIAGAGAFPSEKFVRVVWIGAKPKEAEAVKHSLTNLQAATNEAFAGLFKKEKPAPHLTIARVRSQKHLPEILGFINRHRDIEIGSMPVNEIKLKKSTVTNKGPIYEDVEVFNLGP